MNTLTLEKHCWAEIDLTALRENYEYIRRTVGGPVCAVVKADAYGHGDNVIARVLQEAGARASRSEIATIQSLDQKFGSGQIGSQRNIVIITQTDKGMYVRHTGSLGRISHEYNQINIVIFNLSCPSAAHRRESPPDICVRSDL